MRLLRKIKSSLQRLEKSTGPPHSVQTARKMRPPEIIHHGTPIPESCVGDAVSDTQKNLSILALGPMRPPPSDSPTMSSLASKVIARFKSEFPSASNAGLLRLGQIIDEEGANLKKERKKETPLQEGAERVFNAYPRRVGGRDALLSISKAIATDGLETVMDGTLEFAAAVARWPKARLTSKSGTSFIPLPTTFYNNQRYKLDDRRTWWEGTAKAEKDEKEAILLAEPSGWRFAHPESRFVTENIAWSAIDTASQKWIIANTPQRQQTG